MKCTITIDMDNAAFAEPLDGLTTTLLQVVRRLEEYGYDINEAHPVKDVNGNRVGQVRVSP